MTCRPQAELQLQLLQEHRPGLALTPVSAVGLLPYLPDPGHFCENRSLELGLQRPPHPFLLGESPVPLTLAPGWVPADTSRGAPIRLSAPVSPALPECLLFSYHLPWALPASSLCSVRGLG